MNNDTIVSFWIGSVQVNLTNINPHPKGILATKIKIYSIFVITELWNNPIPSSILHKRSTLLIMSPEYMFLLLLHVGTTSLSSDVVDHHSEGFTVFCHVQELSCISYTGPVSNIFKTINLFSAYIFPLIISFKFP